jgi:hypothetical protein
MYMQLQLHLLCKKSCEKQHEHSNEHKSALLDAREVCWDCPRRDLRSFVAHSAFALWMQIRKWFALHLQWTAARGNKHASFTHTILDAGRCPCLWMHRGIQVELCCDHREFNSSTRQGFCHLAQIPRECQLVSESQRVGQRCTTAFRWQLHLPSSLRGSVPADELSHPARPE